MSGRWMGWWAVVSFVVTTSLLIGGMADECDTSVDNQNFKSVCITTTTPSDNEDLDDESDTASFLIVVEHEDGWRCAASLVSMRTGVTSARCARGRSTQLPRELWALAAAQLARPAPHSDPAHAPRPGTSPASTARRVSRITLAGDRRRGDDPFVDDLAVLELEAPFGSGARARPILMATSRGECEKETTCHAVRAVAAGGTHRARFHVISAAIVSPPHCATRVLRWLEVSDKAICLSGEELCANDRGTGVVCGGKLCGVVSESAPENGSSEYEGCGETHVAQSVARWRTFLHCAHTLRACGRGDCETLCSEHRLLNGDSTTEMETAETGQTIDLPLSTNSSQTTVSIGIADLVPRRSKEPSGFTTTTELPVVQLVVASEPNIPLSLRPVGGPEFEPNRPDFKAGEYGDNAAEYDEASLPSIRTREQVTRSSAPIVHSVTRTQTVSLAKLSPPPAESLRAISTPIYNSAHAAVCLSQLILLVQNNHLEF